MQKNISLASCNLNCVNGGTCQIVNGQPQCQCPCLYSGSACQNCKLSHIKQTNPATKLRKLLKRYYTIKKKFLLLKICG